MADPETGLRCFILADYPDLAAYFDNTYSYCGDSSHEKYAVYDCSYPDKALIVDEKRQQASLAHIIGGWSYQPDCHMRGLGNKPWEAILKAIKEQAGARAPTKKNDRPLNTPSELNSHSSLDTQLRSKSEAQVPESSVQEPQNKTSVISESLRQYHEAINRSLIAQTPPTTTEQFSTTLPPTRMCAPAPAPVVQDHRQQSASPSTSEKPPSFYCDMFKKLVVTETNEPTAYNPSEASTSSPAYTPATGLYKPSSAEGTCGPSIDDKHQRNDTESQNMAEILADLMKQQTAALQHRKAVAATNPSTLSTALGKMDQTVEKEWELVQDNSLQADYLMLWPVSTSEDKEWEVVRADSVEERM